MGAGAFFVIAAIVAAGLIIFGGRTVSTDNIDITIEGGSATVGSGDTVTLLISVKNGNPVSITDTMLDIDFPEGTRSADNIAEPIAPYNDTLGEIAPGQSAERTVRAVFFGSENEKVTIPIRFEYRTAGASSAFIKEETYELTIMTSPLSVSVGALSQVSAGQPFTVAVAVRSNAAAPLSNVALLITYPPGFSPISTNPTPLEGSLFDLGTLGPGEEKVISVRGTIIGEDRETRFFTFTVGTRASAEATTLANPYTTVQAPLTLERTFLAPTLSLNRDTSDALVLTTGETVSGVLSWINTLAVPIQDAQIAVKIEGAVEPGSIRTGNGFYRSADSTILFTKETIAALAQVGPGQTGNGAFTLAVKGGAAAASLRSPTVTFIVSVGGRRLNESNVPTAVNATITRTLKVETDLELTARALRTTGPFKNTGPWPPAADQETTYTIEWSLANSVNSVGGTRVTGVLPSYVRFTGAMSPADGSVTYNETSHTVTWNVGDVPAGTSAKKMSFQVALTPSAAQRATSPALITGQEAAGTDRFTNRRVSSVAVDLSTDLRDDPAWNPSIGQVQ